jgi:hypothetical protein
LSAIPKLAACACLNHCRTWDETQGGKYPPSEHAPSCEHYKPVPFYKIEHDGSFLIIDPRDLESTMESFLEDEETSYTISMVRLTPDQVAAMPEFDGF